MPKFGHAAGRRRSANNERPATIHGKSARDKFDLFVDARRSEYERNFLRANPEPEPPPDVLPTLGLQAGGPGNAALGATLEGPEHRARNPRWYHDVALFVHPDRVMAKLLRSARGAPPCAVAADGSGCGNDRRGCRCPREVVRRWGRLSNGMMQEVNRLRDRGRLGDGDDGDDVGEIEGGGVRDDPDAVSTLRKVVKMAAEGHDAEMREDFDRRYRHWHSVRTQYVRARLDNAVARLARKSEGTVSETQRQSETMEDFVCRIAADIDPEREDWMRRGVEPP